MSQAVLIAIGIDWDGRRQILAVEMANRESRSSWKDFLIGLRKRGLNGVELVVADDHAGLRTAIREVLPEQPSSAATSTSCATPSITCRKADDYCREELRWLYDRRSVEEARHDLAAWIAKWGALIRGSSHGSRKRSRRRSPSTGCRASIISISKAPTCWNASTRRSGDEPMSWRTSPNADACRRLVRALAVETHENWLEAHRYLNMNDLKQIKKIQLRQAA